MFKENLLQMIDAFRDEFEKSSPEVQKYEQRIDSLKAPCQLYFLSSAETKTHLMIITRFQDIPDKTIEMITISPSSYIEQLEQFENNPQWSERHSIFEEGQSISVAINKALLGFGIDVRDKRGLFYEKPIVGMRLLARADVTIWRLYGDLTGFNFENESIRIVSEYKANAERARVQNEIAPLQITESIADSTNGLGTYFYPPILVGEIVPTLRERIENRTRELLDQKAISGVMDGVNFVISKGGLIGLETNDQDKAESILIIVMGTAILMGLPLHALKPHEIANITINKHTHRVTGSQWAETTDRMRMFTNFPSDRRISYSRTKITPKNLENIVEKAKSLISKAEQLNKLKLLSGAYTHLDNNEFSQSFIMSWTIVEIYIHEIWNKKMQTSGVTKKIREDLDRWDFYHVLEVLHFDKIISNDDYYEMRHLNGLRNDIIHDGHQVTKKQTSQCYDLAKLIVKTELEVNEEIHSPSVYLGF